MSGSRAIAAAALVLALSGCAENSEPSAAETAAETAHESAPASETESSPSSAGAGSSVSAQTPIPVTDEPTAIDAGTYHMPRDAWAVTDYSVKIPAGWAMQHGHLFNKHADTPAEFGFYAVTVDEIFSDPCVLYSPPRTVGPGVDALVKALSKQPGPVVSDPVETTLGGHRAVRLDLATPKPWANCPMLEDGVGLQIWLSEPADKHLLMTLDGITSVYILDLRSGRQVFVTAVGGETTDAQKAELRRVLDSIRIPG